MYPSKKEYDEKLMAAAHQGTCELKREDRHFQIQDEILNLDILLYDLELLYSKILSEEPSESSKVTCEKKSLAYFLESSADQIREKRLKGCEIIQAINEALF